MPEPQGETPEGQPAAPQPNPQGETPDADETELPESVKAILAKNRAELRKAAKERDALAAWKREREQGDLTEAEKTQKRIKELEAETARLQTERRQDRFRTAVSVAAQKASALDPEVIALLASLPEGDDYDAEKVVADLKKQRPRLFAGTGSADGASNGRTTAGTDMSALIRQAAGRA